MYAQGGFLSRKMRDNHYRDHIATGPQEISHAENPEPDEIQPLLFDLVRAGKVEAVRNLLSQFEALPKEIKKAIRECAASFGSAAIVDLIDPYDKNSFPVDTLQSSIRAKNIDLFKHVLSQSKDCFDIFLYKHKLAIFIEVLRSDSEEAFETLLSHIESDLNTVRDRSFSWDTLVTERIAIQATAGHPDRENLLITSWEKAVIPKSSDYTLGTALVNVASSTSSVKLAEYLVGHGAKVDFRDRCLTALQCAARHDSAAAAEMMKYLLLQGADPKHKADRARLRICDEKGAKGIAKWLEISWDELVAKTKEEREKREPKSTKKAWDEVVAEAKRKGRR